MGWPAPDASGCAAGGAPGLYVGPAWSPSSNPAVLDQRGARWVKSDRYDVCTDATRFELAEVGIAAQLGLRGSRGLSARARLGNMYAAVARKAERPPKDSRPFLASLWPEATDPPRCSTCRPAAWLVVRASPHYFVSDDQLDQAVELVARVVAAVLMQGPRYTSRRWCPKRSPGDGFVPRRYIASECCDVCNRSAAGPARSGSRDTARAGKIITDNRPAQTSAAPVVAEMMPVCIPMVATVTRNGSDVACNNPAATVVDQPNDRM